MWEETMDVHTLVLYDLFGIHHIHSPELVKMRPTSSNLGQLEGEEIRLLDIAPEQIMSHPLT